MEVFLIHWYQNCGNQRRISNTIVRLKKSRNRWLTLGMQDREKRWLEKRIHFIREKANYTPRKKVWGYIGIILSVCLSACSHLVRAITSTHLSDLDNISHHYCPWPKGVSWPWPKVISPQSMSQYTHTQNPCPGHNSSLPNWIWIIFHTIVVHDPMVCHDPDDEGVSVNVRILGFWVYHVLMFALRYPMYNKVFLHSA